MLSLAFSAFMAAKPTAAQGISLISDEETEQLLGKIARPLFTAAKVRFNRNDIYIVDDPTLNAFVADGNALFVHTGTIIAADSPNELAGVIAHETGHIEGGHILRQKLKKQELQGVTLASAILAGTGSALTHYSRYRTQEERSADEAAMKLLNKTGQSPAGMLTFMKRISTRNTMSGIEEIPYFRTHPITRERISFFEEAAKRFPLTAADLLQNEFERVKAKLYAYLNTPADTYKKYPATDKSISGQYARAIADFKALKFNQALSGLEKLSQSEPDNPYFYELKGQIYLETGKIKPAVAAYRKALSLMPTSALLQISTAQAILEDSPDKNEIQEAINLLNKANISRPLGFSWLLLSRAYGMAGNEAAANYAAAEHSLRIGAQDIAERQAEQAKINAKDAKLRLKIDDLLVRIKNLKQKP